MEGYDFHLTRAEEDGTLIEYNGHIDLEQKVISNEKEGKEKEDIVDKIGDILLLIGSITTIILLALILFADYFELDEGLCAVFSNALAIASALLFVFNELEEKERIRKGEVAVLRKIGNIASGIIFVTGFVIVVIALLVVLNLFGEFSNVISFVLLVLSIIELYRGRKKNCRY